MGTGSPAGVMVSLRPKYARAIASGAKTVELRRRFPELPPGTPIVIYTTVPVAAVTGVMWVGEVIRQSPSSLWSAVGDHAAVSRGTFFDYFEGCESGVALVIDRYQPLAPRSSSGLARVWPGFRPPQSFRYVPEVVLGRLLQGVVAPRPLGIGSAETWT